MKEVKIIFWDFDGVILNSNEVRDKGFEIVLKDFPQNQVNLLMQFHKENGGLSRYVKFRYFFESIRKEKCSNKKIETYAKLFSEIMLKELNNKDLLIKDSIDFIKKNKEKYVMHIVSGSDGVELNHLCKTLEISKFFKTINGSPTPKNDLVKNIIAKYNYSNKHCILIGDSINDYNAAIINEMSFFGYNYFNSDEKINKIDSFKNLNLHKLLAKFQNN